MRFQTIFMSNFFLQRIQLRERTGVILQPAEAGAALIAAYNLTHQNVNWTAPRGSQTPAANDKDVKVTQNDGKFVPCPELLEINSQITNSYTVFCCYLHISSLIFEFFFQNHSCRESAVGKACGAGESRIAD